MGKRKARKSSWQEKLNDSKDLPKTLVIPAPKQVDALMKQVPAGKVTTINELRAGLARQAGTDLACQMTTGIFAWIASHAADEAAKEGKADVTPYWRTLKSDGQLNAKYPGGVAAQKKRLEAEGHKVVRKGRLQVVRDLEAALHRFDA